MTRVQYWKSDLVLVVHPQPNTKLSSIELRLTDEYGGPYCITEPVQEDGRVREYNLRISPAESKRLGLPKACWVSYWQEGFISITPFTKMTLCQRLEQLLVRFCMLLREWNLSSQNTVLSKDED